MANRSSTNNLAAGLFLVVSLVIALAISFWLGGIGDRLGSKTGYAVRFPMEVGVGGLQAGSKVTLAGLEVGRVRSVSRVTQTSRAGDTEARRVVAMEAHILIDASVVLHEDAKAYLVQPILGGISAINVSSVGLAGAPMVEGDTITGGIAPGLLAQMGFGAHEADQIRAILANIEASTEQAEVLLARLDEVAAAFAMDADGSATDLRGVLSDARSFTARFTGEGGWDSQIDSILTDGQTGIARLPEITEDAGVLIKDSRELIAENRPAIKSTISEAEALVSKIRLETAIRFEELLDQGVLTVASYADIGDKFSLMLSREYPQVRRTLTNIRETSDQLKLGITELRTQPWRLLDSPSATELEKEPIYAAARAYAVAVADLRAASESLEHAIGSAEARQSGVEIGIPGVQNLAEMADAVDAAFEKYREAERTMLERLTSK